MALISNISKAMMDAASAGAQTSFQLQFTQIERTVVNRLNSEIDDVVKANSHEREIEKLQKEYNQLAEEMPLFNTFLFGNEGNLTRLQEMGDVISDVVTIFETGATSLTADQASDINTNVEDIIDRIGQLVLVSHPDVSNSDVVFRLKGLLEGFQDYTAVAGVIDAEGTDPDAATNDNRPLYDAMTELQSWVDTGATITSNTIDYTSQLMIDVQTEMFSIEARITAYQATDSERVTTEVDNLKERYAQLLQAISLSFEVSSGFADYLKDGLNGQETQPGSILNLFA